MRSASKKTPASEKKNGKDQTSGKKLVQARLPFKILSGTPPATTPAVGVDSPKLEVLPKKRKLSYTEEPENPKKIGKSDSKENLTLDKVEAASVEVIDLEAEQSQDVTGKSNKSNKIDSSSSESSDSKTKLSKSSKDRALITTEDIVVLIDEDSQDVPATDSPKTPANKAKDKKLKKTTPRSSGSATTPKVQIKLPLSGKKNKRKSKRASKSAKQDVSDSSDVELVSDEQNPHKKAKLTNGAVEQSQEQTSPEEEVKNVNQTISLEVEKGNGREETPKEMEAVSKVNSLSDTIEPSTNEEPMHEAGQREDAGDVEKTKVEEKEEHPDPTNSASDQTEDAGDVEKTKVEDKEEHPDPTTSEEPKKKKSSANSTSKDDTAVQASKEENLASQEKTNKSSRRSTRQAEIEQKKVEAHCNEEKRSPDPEVILVSEKSSAPNTPVSNESRKKLLTPKQLKQMEQRKLAREEKDRKLQEQREERERKLQEQREERERKAQEEKLQKQKEREEKELQKKKEREEKDEQKRREKEEKEEQRRKEKEDKERKRLAEIEAKNEEKRKKDEAKEEERRKKEEDRRRKELEKEEEENKKRKAAQAFTKFFVTKAAKTALEDEPESRDGAESVDSLAFRPFQVKGDMKLAPLVRREFKERSREKLDSFLGTTQAGKADLYLGQLKSGGHIPLRGSKTVLKDNDEYDDVIIIDNELETAAQAIDEARPLPLQTFRAKFYFFRENRRPPFYGTWRKRSTVITPRRPFATDKKFFDYDVDSDDEWEEEEPGESLNGSEDEKDESEDEDYEVDNEWFVPHGHLSDEEMQNEDENGQDTSREAQKAKLKALQQEFAQEMKKKTEKIKPRLIGAIWEDENGNRPKLCPSVIWDSLCTRAMMFAEPLLVEEPEMSEPEPSTPPQEKLKRFRINDELLCDLIRLVHGNRHSKAFLIKEYMEHVANTSDEMKNGECLAPTKTQIREKIEEISEWSVVDANNSNKKNKKKLCWVVSADILDKYSLGKLGLRNEWAYKLQPRYNHEKKELAKETSDKDVPTEETEPSKSSGDKKKKPTTSGITKFAKVLTKEEKRNQLTTTSVSTKSSVKSSPNVIKSKNSPIPLQKTPTEIEEKKPPSASSVSNKTPVVKKRVALLMSVPTGQQFSPQSKNALISNFLQKNKTAASANKEEPAVKADSVTNMEVDQVVVLDQ